MKILFAQAIITSTARVSSVFLSSYKTWFLTNQRAYFLKTVFLKLYTVLQRLSDKVPPRDNLQYLKWHLLKQKDQYTTILTEKPWNYEKELIKDMTEIVFSGNLYMF